MAHTHLCVILSRSMRQILQLKSTAAERTDALRKADESLSQFIMQLPDCLRSPQPQADTWQSFLHLTYNNFLILLHRPPCPTKTESCLTDTSGDSSICADAVAVITSTFEFIGAARAFGELALPSVYTLFTSLVYVSGGITSTNPLVVAKSKRMLDSLLNSLRELAHFYIYPRSILKVFEGQALWERQGRNQCDGPNQTFATDHEQHQTDGVHGDSLDVFLTKCLLDMSPGIDFGPTKGPSDMIFTPSSILSNQTSSFTASESPGADATLSSGARTNNTFQKEPHKGGSTECHSMTGDSNTTPFQWSFDILSDSTPDGHNIP